MPSATSPSERRLRLFEDAGGWVATFRRTWLFWGFWPALVMVLSQWEAARLCGSVLPPAVTAITFAGTLAVYGMDRGLQFLRLEALEERHRPSLASLPVIALIISGLTFFALPALTSSDWSWLLILVLCGTLYPAVTVSLVRVPPGFKELLGAFCFTYLVWGRQSNPSTPLVLCFFILGVANFLAASHADKARDSNNKITSIAQLNAPLAKWAAVCAALLAAAGFTVHTGLSIFTLVALFHAIPPFTEKGGIDAAFAPLLLAPFV